MFFVNVVVAVVLIVVAVFVADAVVDGELLVMFLTILNIVLLWILIAYFAMWNLSTAK